MQSLTQEAKKNGKKPVVKKVLKKTEVKKPVTNEQIQKKAYELYEQRAGQNGNAQQDWLEAKRLLEAGD